MENRFGFREFVIAVLLVAMIVSVWLAMDEMDRQGAVLQKVDQKLTDQSAELAHMRQLLDEGVPAVAPSQSQAPPTTGPGQSAAPGESSGPSAAATTQAEDPLGIWVGRDKNPFARQLAAEKMPGYSVGDNLVSAFGVMPQKLTALIADDAYSADIQGYVLESLAGRDPVTLEWWPSLARAWRISKDGLRIEFELRRGLTFSDGQPLTVEDVIFSYQLMMEPKIEDPFIKVYYDKVAKVEQTGPDRVAFFFKAPYFQAFQSVASISVLPKHFYSKYTPDQINNSTGLLMGSGPYRLADPTSWSPQPGVNTELVRNEQYWGETPPFDRMIFRIISNDAAQFTTFQNGDLDTFGPTPEQYRSMLKDQALLKRTQHFEYERADAGYNFIGWNEKRNGKATLFTDVRVRRAMTMLIDRQAICDQILLGLARVTTGPFGPLTKQYDHTIKPWPFDVAQAKALLKEAGFEDRNNSGILTDAAGNPFRFKLMYASAGEIGPRIASFVKDCCARAGVDVEPEPTDWNVLGKRLDDRDFEAVLMGWTGDIEGDPFQIFDSSQTAAPGSNFVSYSDPQLDKLIAKARETVDESKRMPLWHQVHEIIHEDQPYTFMTVGKSVTFLDARFKNVQVTKTGLNSREEWFVPRDLWKWTKAQ